jgi:hypothetical protein
MIKPLFLFCVMTMLASCGSMMNSHRMKAAQRKMLETHKLQQAGQWEEALAMAERMHSSVSKSITSAPMQKTANGSIVDLRPLLTAWTNGPLTNLKTALQKKDGPLSTGAFTTLRQQCINCHTVLGKQQVLVSDFL